MKGQINNVEIKYSLNNSCHETIDSLICSICNKKTNHVFVIGSNKNNDDVRFSCRNKDCFVDLLNEMRVKYDDDLCMCSITDISYPSKKESKKRIRSGMTLKLRYKILKRDNFICIICGRRPPEVELCIDHIKPVSKGGTNSEDNLRTLCSDCNSGKGVD